MSEQASMTPPEAGYSVDREARTAEQIARVHDRLGRQALRLGLEGTTNLDENDDEFMHQAGEADSLDVSNFSDSAKYQSKREATDTYNKFKDDPELADDRDLSEIHRNIDGYDRVHEHQFILDDDAKFEKRGMGWDGSDSTRKVNEDGSSEVTMRKYLNDYNGDYKGVHVTANKGKVTGEFYKRSGIARDLGEPPETTPLTLQESRDAAAKVVKAQRRAFQQAHAKRQQQLGREKDEFLTSV